MTVFSTFMAQAKLANAVHNLGLQWFSRSIGGTGLIVDQYKNTWRRKRETGYLVEIRYVVNNKRVFKHVEPWVNYPSDVLVAHLALLPPEVK